MPRAIKRGHFLVIVVASKMNDNACRSYFNDYLTTAAMPCYSLTRRTAFSLNSSASLSALRCGSSRTPYLRLSVQQKICSTRASSLPRIILLTGRRLH